jgi:hypothetical protein
MKFSSRTLLKRTTIAQTIPNYSLKRIWYDLNRYEWYTYYLWAGGCVVMLDVVF